MRSLKLMIKRIIDIAGSLFLLALLSPFMIAAAVLIAVTMGRPVLFRQIRPGLHGKLFTLIKFRSMKNTKNSEGELLPDEMRITPLGRLLRKTSFDELPELINVLKGEMSLVGPRPLMPEYLERYTPEQACRHNVKPGITGLAQINGRQNLTFSQRLALDIYYVDHWGLLFDLYILLVTIPKVLFAQGVKVNQTIDDVDDLGLNPSSKLGKIRNLQ